MAHDYRYFPDPDPMPVQISDDWVDKIRDQLPEKPFEKQRRYRDEMNFVFTPRHPPYAETGCSVNSFETAAAPTDVPAKVANWVVNDLLRELGQTNSEEDEENASLPQRCKVTPNMLADLVNLIEDAVISNNVAKEIFPEMFASGRTAKEIIAEKVWKCNRMGTKSNLSGAQAIASPTPMPLKNSEVGRKGR